MASSERRTTCRNEISGIVALGNAVPVLQTLDQLLRARHLWAALTFTAAVNCSARNMCG